MNSDKFINLIINPAEVTKKETNALETIIEEFPYFQAARVLHLKGLKNQHSFKYNKELKKTAAFTTNRTVLFDFITANTLDFEIVSKNEKNILNEIDVIDSKVIDHLYESIHVSDNNNNNNTLNPGINSNTILSDTQKSTLNDINSNLENELHKNKEILEIDKPIKFKKEDTFSFNEWLQLKTKKPIKRDYEVVKESKNIQEEEIESEKNIKNNVIKSAENKDLIALFIKNKPKIKPIKSQVNLDVSTKNTIENTTLMTETLARVYLEQKKYKKAITAFKILSLKYPEKSTFFADRIEAIKFLEKNKS
ncbi:MAG: hypothetical protein L3J23_05735 [Flavobacteriaceae bacterium]|nr:hypothetical protein [Flavobacteriaceae bacterium]